MEPFIGDIRMFAGGYSPNGWALCDGQLLSIASYDALFSLIGTTYGGDGQTNFALPDLRGRVPMHMGPNNTIGENQGTEEVTLAERNLPRHSHRAIADGAAGTSADPVGHHWANSAGAVAYSAGMSADLMSASAMQPTGGNLPHENRQPYLCVNFIIAIEGIYPVQS